ncbi:apolipoprotein N-acyltransferase [uncultured Sphingosinicella sp.]|uniref:apolipoprotein N-acyltransferase n=1 Tax=uncultured Sphingosinicella sp. TaxID=478748 RepID=UPI0030D84DA0
MRHPAGRAGLLFLAGIASSLGFAPWNLWPLTLIGIAWLIRETATTETLRQAAKAGWVFGFGHFLLGTHWIAQAFQYQQDMPAWTGWIGVVLLSAYLAVFPAITVAVARRFGTGLPRVLGFAGCWTIAEALRGVLFSGFPWNPLGAVALPMAGLGQGAALIGGLGLSAVILLAAGGLSLLLERQWRAGAAIIGLTAAAALAGLIPLRTPTPLTTTRLNIVQADIGQDEKWSEDGVARAAAKYLKLSPAPTRAARLLIWPEAAIPDLLDEMPAMRRRLGAHLGPNDLMLLGALKAIRTDDGTAIAARNSLFVLDSEGAILARYDKKRLVPFGEFLPARTLLNAIGLDRLAPGALDFWPGPGPRTLPLPSGFPAVGPLICYEVIFDGRVTEAGYRPAWLLNVSNDAWFAGAGAEMHLAQARLRSIEEGLPMARSTPTGISAVIDANGRVTASMPRGQAGTIDARLPEANAPTLFSHAGRILPLLLAAMLMLLGWRLGKR